MAVSDRAHRAHPNNTDIDGLLGAMTLAEKLGQLNMPVPLAARVIEEFDLDTPMPVTLADFERFAEGSFSADLGPGGGLLGVAIHCPEGPRRQAEFHNRLQEIAATTRLGIPLLQISEGTHGIVAAGATIFPEGLTLGSTWDPELVQRVYAAVAREGRALGYHALCTLVVEPIRDPRLGRNCEGYTEDPWLLSCLTEAIVRGVQGDDVSAADKAIAVLCHYPAQSEPSGGLERGAMEISERALRDTFLPAWTAGIARAGALGVMATYASIDGTPTHSSRRLLTDLLRGELGFEGVVLSEGLGFDTLVYEGICETQKEAGARAIEAGVDVNVTYEDAYLAPLGENVVEGAVAEALVDRAVRRVLQVKSRLGLFEDAFVDVDHAVAVVHSAEHQALGLEAACAGIVLLKNESGTLPLGRAGSIAVIGPNAAAAANQLGDYTVGFLGDSEGAAVPVTTTLQGIRERAGAGQTVTYAKGCEVLGDDRSGFAEAVAAAAAADVAVVVVGEQAGQLASRDATARPTVGERSDVASLDLTGVQEDLIRAVWETGTPTVAVLVNGRPLSVRWAAEHVPAIVEAWLPGEHGGQAVAAVLFGEKDPSGRLPVTIPRHVGQLPAFYNHRRAKGYWTEHGYGYVDMPATPLWEFGHGLSYTTFEYSNLRVDPAAIDPDGEVRVSVDVTNTGARAGTEVVQLYLRDVVASVAPFDRQLRGFEKVTLEPAASTTVAFTLGREHLALLDEDLRSVVEPGAFEVLVGSSCRRIHATGSFQVRART